jgi:hypothetical protein
VAPIFGAAPLYIKKDKKWQMPLIMRPVLVPTILLFSSSSISSLLLLAFGPLPNAKFNWTEEARGGEEKRREEKKGEFFLSFCCSRMNSNL